MDDLNTFFNIDDAITASEDDLDNDIDIYSTPEDTLDRVSILRQAVVEIFGKKAAFDHEFFDTKQPKYHNKTPYRMACEGPQGLKKALNILKQSNS